LTDTRIHGENGVRIQESRGEKTHLFIFASVSGPTNRFKNTLDLQDYFGHILGLGKYACINK
jgi:hypothetical protein